MNKLIYKIAVLLISVSLVSCEKGLMTFDNKNADVYFSDAGRNIPALAFDSTYVSFSYAPKTMDSIKNIVVAVTGGLVDHDREYLLEVSPLSTAISGIHYEALPGKFVIKKNKLLDTIKLKIKKTPDMKTESFIIQFNLLTNENFGNVFKTRKITGKTISTISTKVKFDDIIKKPALWNDAYWGTFSRTKLFFMCEFLEIDPKYLDTGSSIALAEFSVFGKIVKRRLDELKAAGTPVLEDNGSEMKMGASS
ncbi:DUF4843 domain-containing protein [Pedobacter nyackensis]|uniref:DUF4843 domain-containing protein n=1 Tax=Pedobacter nyackensis TaxID=475255 RepID=A0A1W2CQ54_9SPHI|nr:DUF4843 domain-containing protein [Pedobacter nyackensis]SMC87360.1 protein of unknown function [Pedobacter nyackensis]